MKFIHIYYKSNIFSLLIILIHFTTLHVKNHKLIHHSQKKLLFSLQEKFQIMKKNYNSREEPRNLDSLGALGFFYIVSCDLAELRIGARALIGGAAKINAS